MKNRLNIVPIFIFGLALFLIYHPWFTSNPIIGGDWPFFYQENLKELPLFVPSWNTWQGNGMGGTNPAYFLQTFENFTLFFTNNLYVSWILTYKILWFGLSIFLAVFSSIYFSRVIFPAATVWTRLMTALIFSTNTYVLMLADGGQMGVLLSYTIAPLVLGMFINLITFSESKKFLNALIAGLVLSIQVMFDPRIAYITMVGVGVYFVYVHFIRPLSFFRFFSSAVYTFLIPTVVTLFLHATWILPYFLAKQNFINELGDTYSGIGIVKFLSFGSFSQTISLLHPNWPENIFGKVYFMKPEFLLVPLFAFGSLLFQYKSTEKKSYLIPYFVLLGLIGAFLAKGANFPFGGLYLEMFSRIPGFILFRDSTKFYTLIGLSYCILIPYCFEQIVKSRFIIVQFLRKLHLIYVSFFIFWLILLLPAVRGNLNGTFAYHEQPQEYVLLKNFLYNQPGFFRTLWVPRQQRFTFYSDEHPSLESDYIFNTSNIKNISHILKKPDTEKYLQTLGIKYIIVPYDSLGEIFLQDRKYDEKSYMNIVNNISLMPRLKRIDGFGKIAVFQTPAYNSHVYLLGAGEVKSKMISPVHYAVVISTQKSQKLIFSEKYNSFWIAKINEKIVPSERTPENLNSFTIEKGNYNLDIVFSQERYYTYGRIISFISLLLVSILILTLVKAK